LSPSPLLAAISFFALGANVLAIAVLLLLNPRSRAVRWYAFFALGIMGWLFFQGLALSGVVGGWVWWGLGVSVHLMPMLFLAASLVEAHDRPFREAAAIVVAAAATLLVIAHPVDWQWSWAWHAAGWGLGALAQSRRSRGKPRARAGGGRRPRLTKVELALLLMVPVVVPVGFLTGGGFFVYGMPLLTVVIQYLIFVGVVRHRFYDVEVRAARTGELAAEAAESSRLATLGMLAASLAHEVRNPLTGVRSLAQRLAEEEIPADQRRRYAGVILEETGRVERLVANLLGLARRGAPAAGGPTDLAPLFDDLLLLVEGRARRSGVALEADADGLATAAPREPLAQALLNLLLNAVAHSPEGGRVRLHARPGPAAGTVEVRVRDEGPGVPPGEREAIFEPFRGTGGSTGLGLAIVRRQAEAAGWTVSVHDAPGGGAEFRLLLPEPGGDGRTAGAGEALAP
jgi:signal transduction histidine kinase